MRTLFSPTIRGKTINIFHFFTKSKKMGGFVGRYERSTEEALITMVELGSEENK